MLGQPQCGGGYIGDVTGMNEGYPSLGSGEGMTAPDLIAGPQARALFMNPEG